MDEAGVRPPGPLSDTAAVSANSESTIDLVIRARAGDQAATGALFDRYGVQLAFENHDHTFKRTYPLRAGKLDPRGTVYLGDGCLSEHPRGVFKLRVSLDARQPAILEECSRAVAVVAPGRRVGRQAGRGCVIVGAYWKHWRCLFPQHGPGRKHHRPIQLEEWQLEITETLPDRLLRGLIQADGCRVANRVGRRAYPRYMFSNRSLDILRIFCRACEAFGVSWTQPSFKHISVARGRDVARLDAIIGPKH
jgi:hypothetical protein